jgi:dolichol-phosphate mannosyltransferase
MDLSIVIPVFNEADNVALLCHEIHDALDTHLSYEVIFVNDASTDGTDAVLQALLAKSGTIRVIQHAVNAGQSAALLNGVRAARASWVVTLDGDGQNDPADILKLLQARDAASTPPAMLIGWRQRREDDWLRRLSSRTANQVRRRLLHDDTPDTGCGLKLFQRGVFLSLPTFDHMHRFLPALVQLGGGTVVTVPVNHRPRWFGRSKYGLFDRLWVGIVDLLGVMWLRRRRCVVTGKELAR